MAAMNRKGYVAGLIGIIVSVFIACGGDTSGGPSAQTGDTGSIAFKIVFEPNADAGSHSQGKAFSSCRDINTVTAQVFDASGDELSELHRWPCDAGKGTIKGVQKGIDRQVVVRGVWLDNDGHATLFYEGRATGLTVKAGETTEVDALVAKFKAPDDPDQLAALLFLADQDDDNYTESDGDCDDLNPLRNPGAEEKCNGVDDNCNGIDDEPYRTFYLDEDGDGFGTEGRTIQGCMVPVGYALQAMDCNDADPAIHPGAEEIQCDGLDNDCDGEKSCDNPDGTYYLDADKDGFGDQSQSRQGFAQGYVLDSTDCNDANPNVHPGATETCNGIDDNCDGQTDEGLAKEYHPDADKDGYGDPYWTTVVCEAPLGYVADAGDCDDGNGSIHPQVAEQCNDIDDNCNGEIDEGLSTATYYADLDGDGFGDPEREITDCAAPTGYVTNSEDCNDANRDAFPGGEEVCNGIDDNCDGQIDEGCPWNKTFGGAYIDAANSIIRSNTGGYVIAGYTDSDGTGSSDAWVIKIDENGNELWNQTYGGSDDKGVKSVTAGNDGGYVIAGYTGTHNTTQYDAWITKIDENGDELWTQVFGESNMDSATSVIQGNTGGYVIAGFTKPSYVITGWKGWIIKIDEDGNEQWTQTRGGDGVHGYVANALISANTSGYAIAGESYSNDTGAWVTKIDEDGNEQWSHTFGGTGNDFAYSIAPGNTGGYIMAGATNSYSTGNFDFLVVKIDENGNEQWLQTFGGTGGEGADSITPCNTGGYVVAGSAASDAWVIKIDDNGSKQWNQTFGGTESDGIYSIAPGNAGDYVMAGVTYSFGAAGESDAWVIKIDENGNAPATP